ALARKTAVGKFRNRPRHGVQILMGRRPCEACDRIGHERSYDRCDRTRAIVARSGSDAHLFHPGYMATAPASDDFAPVTTNDHGQLTNSLPAVFTQARNASRASCASLWFQLQLASLPADRSTTQ